MSLKQDMKVYYETFPDALKQCDFCNRKFRTLAGLRTHALRMHPLETAPICASTRRCPRCNDTGWLDGDPLRGISDEPCGCDENWEE
jgi:hypothetical protein